MITNSNPILQVVIMYASHVCSQDSFGLPLRMKGHMKQTGMLVGNFEFNL